MMTLITGDFGSGKTTALAEMIRADVAAGQPSYLLVPLLFFALRRAKAIPR